MKKLAILFLFLCCFSCDLFKKNVEFQVDGNAQSVDIICTSANGGILNLSNVAIPWKHSYHDQKDAYYAITVYNNSDYGYIGIAVYCNGEVLDMGNGVGPYCTVFVDGIVQ